jgi:hypothetical protein
LAVKEVIHGPAHLFQAQFALDIPLKDAPGFRRRLQTFHTHRGKRVLNLSFALYSGLIEIGGRYRHPAKPLTASLF